MKDSKQINACDQEKDICQLIDEETEKRCCQFHEFLPGCEECEVTPISVTRMIPAIISFFLISLLLIYGMVGIFPKYYQ